MNYSDSGAGRDFTSIFAGVNISHAYIIWGSRGSGRTALAEKLAAAMVCSGDGGKPCMACADCKKAMRGIHPDITVVGRYPDKNEIIVDQMRALKEDAVVMPNEADEKVYIIKDAGTMNVQAQNSVLKLLEEPPAHVNFILIAENPAELLPTVRSRCVEIGLNPPDMRPEGKTRDMAEAFLAALGDGPFAMSEFSFKLDKLGRNDFGDFIAEAKDILARELRKTVSGTGGRLSAGRLVNALNTLDRAAEYLELNVGTVHIAGMLCAELTVVK